MYQFSLSILPLIYLCFLGLFVSVQAQQQNDFKYHLKGVIRDQNSMVIAGLRLTIHGEGSSSTDINGEFQFMLSNGDYVLTSEALTPDKFCAFIKITDKGLNPNYIEFVIDSSAITCSGHSGNSSPKIISSEQPKYPAAARAIRAAGEVAVELKIAQNGDVISAKAVRGHPLLRATSVTAAKNFTFESSEVAAEREVQLIFVFLPEQTKKEGLKRYECPYRMMVVPEASTIDITNTQAR